jgi:hypothetical protein
MEKTLKDLQDRNSEGKKFHLVLSDDDDESLELRSAR